MEVKECHSDEQVYTVTSLLGVVRGETVLKPSAREGSKTLPFNLVLSYPLS